MDDVDNGVDFIWINNSIGLGWRFLSIRLLLLWAFNKFFKVSRID